MRVPEGILIFPSKWYKGTALSVVNTAWLKAILALGYRLRSNLTPIPFASSGVSFFSWFTQLSLN